jgi:hypothetical protein
MSDGSKEASKQKETKGTADQTQRRDRDRETELKIQNDRSMKKR